MGLDRLRVLVATALAGFALSWLAYAELYAPSGGRALAWRRANVERLQLPRPATEIFRTRADLHAFVESLDVAIVLPRVDFAREAAVLLAVGPRSSAGYTIQIVRVEEQRGRVLIVARENSTARAVPRVDYPSAFVVIRETGKPIAADWID